MAFARRQRFLLVARMGLFALIALLIHVPRMAGQVVTATLQGTAQDSSGAAIQNATITLTNVSTGISQTATSDSRGRFVFPLLPPGGPYAVKATARGFQTAERTGIELELNQVADITLSLPVGSQAQTVEVNADATQLETATSTMGQVISNRGIVDLPLNQRNVYSLIFLVPGVTGSVNAQYNSLNFSVNGGRPGTTTILVDGIPASPQLIVPIAGFAAFPSVDAVQEFKVELNSYPAQFGRSLSGIVNVILKPGTNAFHGSAYEFARNSVLDANSWFAKAAGIDLPPFSRNQFGGSINGPVRIPKLYNGRDKTFFMFSYEGLRQGTQAEITASVPTALQRRGDFSQTFNSAGQLVVIYDPLTTTASGNSYVRQPFPGNVIPAGRIDPVAAAVMDYYPLPNRPGTPVTGLNNFFASGTDHLNINTIDTRVDENISDADRFFVRYSHRGVSQPPLVFFPGKSALAEGAFSQPQTSNSAAIDFTHTFSPRFLMEIPFGFARTAFNFVAYDSGFDPTQLGFPSYIAENADHLLFPQIAPANYYSLGNSGTQRRGGFNVFSLGANFTLIRGSHVLGFGVEGREYQSNDVESPASTGNFSFTNAPTQGPNPNAATATAGNSLASLLLGVGNGVMNINLKNSAVQSRYFAAYLQDDWKVTQKLTINAGLRYDLDLPRTERHNRMETFDPTVPSPLAQMANVPGLHGGVVFTGTDGSSRRQFDPRWNDVGPRLGLSYQIEPAMVVRASYGIYFGPSLRSSGNLLGNEGFSSSSNYVGSPNGLTPSVYLSNPFPNGPNLPVGTSQGLLTGIGTNFETSFTGDNKVGYTENWDLDVQRELPFSVLADVAYVGSHGVHLNKGGEGDWNANQLTHDALALGTQLQQPVTNPFYGIIKTGPESGRTIARSYLVAPFPQFTGIGLLFPIGGYEDFNSIQVKVVKRLSHGLSLLASYTGQKQIDNYSGIENVGHITGGIQDIYNPAGERAVSSNDISRHLVVSATYELPFGRGRLVGANWNRAVDLLLGEWQVNGIATEQNGFPISVTTQNTSNSGSNVLRPNLTGAKPGFDGPVRSKLNAYLNKDAFAQPAPFTFGNAPRTLSSVRTPGTHNIDFSLFKSFPLHREMSLQLRAEAFNLLNQVVFAGPNSVLTSGQFGRINGQANAPRQLQFAAKFLF